MQPLPLVDLQQNFDAIEPEVRAAVDRVLTAAQQLRVVEALKKAMPKA